MNLPPPLPGSPTAQAVFELWRGDPVVSLDVGPDEDHTEALIRVLEWIRACRRPGHTLHTYHPCADPEAAESSLHRFRDASRRLHLDFQSSGPGQRMYWSAPSIQYGLGGSEFSRPGCSFLRLEFETGTQTRRVFPMSGVVLLDVADLAMLERARLHHGASQFLVAGRSPLIAELSGFEPAPDVWGQMALEVLLAGTA